MIRIADDLIQWIKSNAGREAAGSGEETAGNRARLVIDPGDQSGARLSWGFGRCRGFGRTLSR